MIYVRLYINYILTMVRVTITIHLSAGKLVQCGQEEHVKSLAVLKLPCDIKLMLLQQQIVECNEWYG